MARPPKAQPTAAEQPAKAPARVEEERTALNHATDKAASIGGIEFRRARGPLDGTDKKTLDVPPHLLNDELSYRWVNEHNGLVDKRRELGYETVPEIVGASGEKITTRRRVGTNKDGSPQYAVLMATPKHWKQERDNAAEAERQRLEQSIQTGNSDGKASLGDDFYVKRNTKIN